MGDFNIIMDNKFMIDFCSFNDNSSLIDKPTSYKNFDESTCIDLIFQTNPVTSNTLRFLGLTLPIFILRVTEFKSRVKKRKPQVIN